MQSDAIRSGLLVTTLVVAALGTTFVGVAAAAENGTVNATPEAANATANHTVTLVVGEGVSGNWTALTLDYGDSGADVMDVGLASVLAIGIDEGNDNAGVTENNSTDVDASGNLTTVLKSGSGNVTINLDGSRQLESGDQVVAAISDVKNPPEEGEYNVSLAVRAGDTVDRTNATLQVGPPNDTATGTTTTAAGGDGTTAADGDDTTTEDGDGGTGIFGPGFGLVPAVLALVAAAFLALRRID